MDQRICFSEVHEVQTGFRTLQADEVCALTLLSLRVVFHLHVCGYFPQELPPIQEAR